MSWVTIIWSMIAAVSATLATIYLLIWFRERRSWAYLCFFVLAVGVIGMAASEFAAMHAKSPTEYGAAVRWGHFANGLMAVGALGFVHFFFGTGKGWLLGAGLGLRLLAVVVNFSTGLNLHISAIQALQQVNFLGEPVSMLGQWTPNPWVRLGQFAALAQVVYVVDASLRLWRTGRPESRRRAVMVGGTLAFFTLFSSAQAGLVVAGVLRMPIIVSFPFLAVLLAMSWELSLDVRRAVQLGRELRESEQRMALAAEAANLGVWVRDLARDEIWASDRWRVLFGFTTTEQLDLDKFLQRLHPDDREIFRQSVAKATSGDGRYEAEFRVALPDGRIRWIISRGRVEFGRGGKPVRVRGISGDITDRKRAEEANRNVQELMAAVFNSVPGLLYLYTEDGRLVKWNKQHELMTGYTAAELLDFRIQDWFDEENRLKLAQEFPKIFSEGYTQVEMSLILKNKQKMPIFATGSKLMLDGKPHMVGIAMDITARKKAEAELRQSEERFHAVVEQASDGFELLDLDGRYLEVNAATLRQLGYTREEVLRLTIFDVDPLLDRDRFIKESPTITGTKPLRLETVHRRKDGSTFPVEVTVSTIQIGSRRCLFALVRDITERKQTEAEVLRQRAELAHVSRVSVMGELSASMAHELNQPLTAILSNTQAAQRFLAADKLDRAEFDEILKDIVHDTTRARDVIRHLRALVKKSEREFVRVDVNEIISQVVAFLHGDIVGRNVTVIQELAPELPLVLGDRTQLQQVLLNLLLNAFDAVSGKRVPDRRVTVLTAMASPEMVRVAVRDGGVGIPPGKFDEIFQPFFTTKTEGLGMGLSVSRSIIEGHGGRLTAENNAGPGATLSFTLPVVEQ